MQTQEVSFTVTKQDYRAANYYIHFMNRMLPILLMVGILLLFLVYRILIEVGVLPFWEPSLYIASFAVFWILLQVTKLETAVRRYAKSPSSILGKKSILRYTDTRMTMKVPEAAFNSSGLFADYPAAFETRSAFLIYTSGADLFLVPRRAFTDEKRDAFRNILIKAMGDRLSSRYNRNAPHIPTAAEIAAEEAKQTKNDKPAASEAAPVPESSGYQPHRNSIADRANLVNNRGKNAEKKHE